MIESVEEKFVVVNLGKTMALMPRAAQIPGERYVEGQSIRVVITECNKDTKGAQVLVSRSDAKLVKRLFEKEVPEIYQGVVEIKAIAREAGERTKMAVWSNNPDVDAIGACIGPRGSRVQVVIDELKGEKIDIFEWSDNISELIKNALAPAQILAVLPTEDKRSLLVVVEDKDVYKRQTYDEEVAHRADYDADVLASVFMLMIKECKDRGAQTVADLQNLQDKKAFVKVMKRHVNVIAKNQAGLKDLFKMCIRDRPSRTPEASGWSSGNADPASRCGSAVPYHRYTKDDGPRRSPASECRYRAGFFLPFCNNGRRRSQRPVCSASSPSGLSASAPASADRYPAGSGIRPAGGNSPMAEFRCNRKKRSPLRDPAGCG